MARNPNTLVVVMLLVAMVTILHSSAARPAPQPTSATPPPTMAPDLALAPAPSTGAVTYTVGDTIGWTIPTNAASSYVNWASGKTFKVGDILVFNYQNSAHNVEEVTKEEYISCRSVNPIATYNNPPVRVTLDKIGTHYFLCGVPGHCFAGQKLTINVTNNTTSPSSAIIAPPSTSTIPSSPSPEGATLKNSGAASLGSFTTLLSVAAAAFLY